MPPHPPVRTVAADYHYHVYDYRNAPTRGTWGLSDPVAGCGNYRFYSMAQDLQGLVTEGKSRYVPGIALTRVGPKTAKGGRTLVLSFGNSKRQRNQRTVVITGGIHAREWIATEMAYLLAEYLVVNYNVTPPPGNARLKALRNLIDNRNIVIIPLLNPDGLDVTVFGTGTGDRLWRKNLRAMPGSAKGWVDLLAPYKQPNRPYRNVRAPGRPKDALAQYDVPAYNPGNNIPPKTALYKTQSLARSTTGVDLNRNLPTIAYGYDSPPKYSDSLSPSETFHGTGAASEPEIANLRKAVLEATRTAQTGGRLWATVDYHSFGKKILYGEETTRAGLTDAHKALGQALHYLITDQDDDPTYQLEDGSSLLGYLPVGTVDDYMTQAHQAYSFTIELDPADDEQDDDENPIEFKLPEDRILDVFRQNIRAALAAISAPVNPLEAQNAVKSYIGWDVYSAGNQVP